MLHTPHTFQLIDSSIKPLDEKVETPEDPYCFYVIGCADNRPEMQKKVAELMNKNAHKDKPKFILILGDNFTGHGVDSSTDDLFLKNFHDIYQNATVDYINGIPCFIILGNHDVDARNAGVNLNKGFAQCEHTYVNLETGKIDEEAIKQFQSSSELDLAKLRTQKNKWIMPSRYYSIRHKDEMEMFFIDANTLVDDFIEYYIDGKEKA